MNGLSNFTDTTIWNHIVPDGVPEGSFYHRDRSNLFCKICWTIFFIWPPMRICSCTKATVTPDRTIAWSHDRLPFGERATDRQCLLRSPAAIAYCDRSFFLVVGHRTIGRTRGRAINNDRTTSGSHKLSIVRSIVRSIVGPDDRSYDQ